MRIDKLRNTVVNYIFSPNMITDILEDHIPITLRLFSFLISLKRKRLLLKKWSFKGLKNIEGIEKYYISMSAFDPKHKKDWISAFARLKNGDQFLEKCLLSIKDYVDEVILLVDINSTDNTSKICQKLSKKYPNIFKYYEYEPEVYPWNHLLYSETPDNSVHSLSYFYNYCLSKVSYNYVMKMDDDMLCVKWNFAKMTKFIKINRPKYFLNIPQIQISIDKRWNLAIANKFLSSGIAGIFGDHGIFPISPKTYFYNDVGCENLIAPHNIKYGKIWFLHLKNLKMDGWVANYSGYGIEYVNSLFFGTNYLQIPQKYKEYLKNL